MEKYEVAVLVKPLLPEDIKTKVIPALEQTVKKLNGSMSLTDDWGKKHLAYPIQGHEEGYYFFLNLDLNPSNLDKLNRAMRLMRDVLRFLIVKEGN